MVKASFFLSYPVCVHPHLQNLPLHHTIFLLHLLHLHSAVHPSLSSLPVTVLSTLTSSSSLFCPPLHASLGLCFPFIYQILRLRALMCDAGGFLWLALLLALIRAPQMTQHVVPWTVLSISLTDSQEGIPGGGVHLCRRVWPNAQHSHALWKCQRAGED